jgi:hypothetical protein
VTQVLVLVAISFIAIGGLNLRRAAGAASAT